jgi:hypothetical protein
LSATAGCELAGTPYAIRLLANDPSLAASWSLVLTASGSVESAKYTACTPAAACSRRRPAAEETKGRTSTSLTLELETLPLAAMALPMFWVSWAVHFCIVSWAKVMLIWGGAGRGGAGRGFYRGPAEWVFVSAGWRRER